MLPITPPQATSRFRHFIRETKSDLTDDQREERRAQLRRRLEDIRDGLESTPLTGINSNHAEVLNDNSSKRKRYGLSCPECQNIYKKNASRSKEIVLFSEESKRVEISS